jgi:protein-disulfide isomerase
MTVNKPYFMRRKKMMFQMMKKNVVKIFVGVLGAISCIGVVFAENEANLAPAQKIVIAEPPAKITEAVAVSQKAQDKDKKISDASQDGQNTEMAPEINKPAEVASTTAVVFSDEQKAAVQNIVRDYLLENPHLLVEVSQRLQAQEQEKAEEKARSAIDLHHDLVFSDKHNPVMGNPDGDISLVEFFDYQCIHCKEEATVIEKLIKANPRLRVVLKDLPIFGENSRYASLVSLAVFESMKDKSFVNLHRALFGIEGELSEAKVQAVIKAQGLDLDKVNALVKLPEYTQQIERNYELANLIGINGTPAFVIAKTGSHSIEEQKKMKLFFVPGAADEASLQDLINQVK